MNHAFVEFAIQAGVLKFGEFTLKSGRISPYFFNAGLFNSGSQLAELATFYADCLVSSGIDFDQLFGPAYKGITLASATAVALHQRHHRDIPYLYNRKEEKDHGEGGMLVGAAPSGKIVIIDDVITAGTAIREAVSLVERTEAEVVSVMVAIDRQERGNGDISAIQEVEQEYGFSVISIVKLQDILSYLRSNQNYSAELAKVEQYRDRYGTD